MFGFLSVNKPIGQSSRSMVDVVEKIVRPLKVGHTGTLDPLASGVLVLGIGPATRLTRFVQRQPKSYVGTFQLGVSSPTDDLERELSPVENAPTIAASDLEKVLPEFTGEIEQAPPAYSAVKINGRRAYRLSRAGKVVLVNPRPVVVHSLRLVEFDYPDFKLEIECGAGTYVRSLGRDIGRRLGSAAVMTSLVRTQVGQYKIADSNLPTAIDAESLGTLITAPIRIFDDIETVCLNNRQICDLKNGALFAASDLTGTKDAERIAAVDDKSRLLALLSRHGTSQFRPELNFAHYYQSLDDS